MSDNLKIDYHKLINYVDAASNLAEGLSGDLRGSKKGRISNETVLNLAKFYSAANAVQKLMDTVEQDKRRIN